MRTSVKAMDNLIGQEIKVLDKGFVRVIDYMGDDAAIVQAARVSYGAGTKTMREDAALIDYLMRNAHTSPFEMCEIKLHVKLPIFLARQWMRHRTGSFNEVSARYSEMTDDVWLLASDTIRAQSKSNKQTGDGAISDRAARLAPIEAAISAADSADRYRKLLEFGVSREQARAVMPLSTYTEFYWKVDLHNLLHFLNLRLHPHAQKEIRDYALVINEIVGNWVPMTLNSFDDHVRLSKRLTAGQINAVISMLECYPERYDPIAGISDREAAELEEWFQVKIR